MSSMTILVSILILDVDATVDVQNSLYSPNSSFSLEEFTVDLDNFKVIDFSGRQFGSLK